jgi:hypothetical protein
MPPRSGSVYISNLKLHLMALSTVAVKLGENELIPE